MRALDGFSVEAWVVLVFLVVTTMMVLAVWRLARRADRALDREDVRKRFRIWPVPPTSM